MSNYTQECAEWSDTVECSKCQREYERNRDHDSDICPKCKRIEDGWKHEQDWWERER